MTPSECANYAFMPAPQASLRVQGTDLRYPVRRIYCVGRNYADHAREMGADPTRERPFFFMKPADAVREAGARIAYPPRTADLQYEVELVVAIARAGSDVPAGRALDHVFGYGVGIDLTRRDLQSAAKKAGHPWDSGKGFDGAAPVSELRRASDIAPPVSSEIRLSVNGTVRQSGTTRNMIWSVPEIIAELSALFELRPGDLVFTGTPSGVGSLQPGDVLAAEIDGVGRLDVCISGSKRSSSP